MEIYQENGKYFLRILNREISAGTANIIQIKGPALPLPDNLKSLNDIGRDWICVALAEATTGCFRYSSDRNPTGWFATNLASLRSKEAQQILELTIDQNKAEYKHKLRAPVGATVMVGKMTSSSVIQFYFLDTTSLVALETTTLI